MNVPSKSTSRRRCSARAADSPGPTPSGTSSERCSRRRFATSSKRFSPGSGPRCVRCTVMGWRSCCSLRLSRNSTSRAGTFLSPGWDCGMRKSAYTGGDSRHPEDASTPSWGRFEPAERRVRAGRAQMPSAARVCGDARRIRQSACSGSCRGPPGRGRHSGGWPRADSGSGRCSARWRWRRWSGRRDCAAGGARTPGSGLRRR